METPDQGSDLITITIRDSLGGLKETQGGVMDTLKKKVRDWKHKSADYIEAMDQPPGILGTISQDLGKQKVRDVSKDKQGIKKKGKNSYGQF